jgi:methyltransferase family protein
MHDHEGWPPCPTSRKRVRHAACSGGKWYRAPCESTLMTPEVTIAPKPFTQLARGLRALDAVNRVAELFPTSRFVGMDLSNEAIQVGREEASAKGLKNVEFATVDLSEFERPNRSRSTSSRRSMPTIKASR